MNLKRINLVKIGNNTVLHSLTKNLAYTGRAIIACTDTWDEPDTIDGCNKGKFYLLTKGYKIIEVIRIRDKHMVSLSEVKYFKGLTVVCEVIEHELDFEEFVRKYDKGFLNIYKDKLKA